MINKLANSDGHGCCILWLKATSTSVTFTITSSNNVGAVLKCSSLNIDESIKKLSTLIYLGRDLKTYPTIPGGTSGYSMLLTLGRQGGEYNCLSAFPKNNGDMSVISVTACPANKSMAQWILKTDTSYTYTMATLHTAHLAWYAY